MAQVGSLVIDLIAETASFNANVKKAAANLNSEAAKMNRSLQSVSSGIKTIVAAGAALAGAAVVGEITRLARAGLEYASSLGEISQQIGVTTQDLQIYRYAATQVGLSTEEMDKGLQKLTRTLGDAQNGSKSAGAVFAALGVELRTANGHFRTTSEVLPDLADAISRIPDPARRASVEVQLFGKSGQKLDTLLSGGSAAVKQFGDDIRGSILTDAQIQKADDAADALARIKATMEARIAGAVADNINVILGIATALTTATTAALDFLGAWAKTGPAFEKRDRMANFAKAEIDRNKSLSDAEKARAKAAIDKEVDRKFGVKRSSSFGGLIESRSIDLSKVKPAQIPRIAAPKTLVGGGDLGQFLAAGGSRSKGGTQAKAKVERTWLDDFREMASEMSIDFGNELARQNPLEGTTSKWISDFTDDALKYQMRLVEVQKEGEKSLDLMKTNWVDASNTILYSLRDMADGLRSGDFLGALQGVVNLFLQLGSLGVFGKGLKTSINAGGGKGFDSGGYTGSLGTSEVAGVVHGQEYVFDAKATRRIGVENLERLRRGGGFMRGGYTGGPRTAIAGLEPRSKVEIVPSPLFDVVVDGRAQRVAVPIGVRAAQSGAGLAVEQTTRARRNRIPGQ